jgi:uncharacterized protein with FMN-binding domain
MLLGFITAALLLLMAAKFLTRRLPWRRLDAFAMCIHPYAGAAALVLGVVHVVITFGVLPQRPTAMGIVGIVMATSLLAAALSRLLARRMGKRWLTVHRITAVAACICLVAHIALGVTSFADYQRTIAALAPQEIPISRVSNGTYEGECDAGYIYAQVRVTVENGEITDIDLLEHRNERGGAAERIPQDVIEAQSLDVDTVSGATNSSRVIKEAIANALEKGID